MDIYTKSSKFDSFVLFMNEHKDNLHRNDLIQYYTGALVNNNTKVINYLLKEYKYILEEDYIIRSLNLLTDYKWISMVEIFITNKIEVSSLLDKVIESFLMKLNSVYNDMYVKKNFEYIIFLLNNTKKVSLEVIKNLIINIGYNKHNVTYILTLIDLVILFGNNELNDSNMNEELKLLFLHKEKDIVYIYNKLDLYVKNLLKNEFEVDTDKKVINTFKKKKNLRFITKIQNDFYIMNDRGKNWVFDNENIEYIKKHKKNPYNGEIIPDDLINNI